MNNFKYKHIPVMLNEAIEYLDIKKGGSYIDCTLGGGGYTKEILKKIGEEGEVVSFDLDILAVNNANNFKKEKKIDNLKIINDNFKNLSNNIKKIYKKDKKFDGIVFDLGLSSAQLEDRNRGFSFKLDASIDMAFGPVSKNRSTEYIINNYKEEDLKRIFNIYGEERFAPRIAKKICEERKKDKIKTAKRLSDIINSAIPERFKKRKTDPSTKSFQALRIATNDELANLEKALPQAVDLLKKEGRIVVITYHSLEDRIVKNFFKTENKPCQCPPEFPICICNKRASIKIIPEKGKKFILPSGDEINTNKRARSAKLRVAIKI
jgi:16S rRNA (cytosine1402-N4)-methyltransferase